MKVATHLRRFLALTFALGVIVGPQIAHADGTDPTKISIPKGPGSIEGLGRSFQASLASGTASFGLDIAVPPAARGFGPSLSLEYDGAGGITELGMGFRLGGIPSIRRRTQEGFPRFDASDEFELVGLGIPSALLEITPGVFRPEQESGAFVRVKRAADGKSWEARTKAGITLRFGGDGYFEQEGDKIATYLLKEQLDLHGHKVAYSWDTQNGYALLQSVTWNAFTPESTAKIELKYEANPTSYELFSAGIRQVIQTRVESLEVTYGGSLVRKYTLHYTEGKHSRLSQITLVGTDGVTEAPKLTLGYTESILTNAGQAQAMTTPPGRSPAEPGVEFADLNGDSLPDLLVGNAGTFRSYVNQDGASWRPAADFAPGQSPSVSLGTQGVQLADLDGDAAIDLVVKSGAAEFRYLPGLNEAEFKPSVAIKTVPTFSFEDPDVRLADIDGDRRADALITTAAGLAIAYNLGGADWAPPVTVGKIDAQQELRFSDGKTSLCDINGDRLQDFCYLRSEGLTYWLGRGRGQFEPARTATGVPTFDATAPFRLVDLDGDGWDDLVRVGVSSVSFALSEGIGTFGALQTLTGTPEKALNSASFFVDINGSGSTDIVWVDPTLGPEKAWQYLELFPQGRAGLLRRIDNGLGKVTSIEYATAASFAASARTEGKPWATRVNAGLPVVRRIVTNAGLGDPQQVTEFIYRDGTWDATERTFAGFASGVQKELGDQFTPTLVSETSFNLGLSTRALRGTPLTVEMRDDFGKIFNRTLNGYVELPLENALNSRSVRYGYLSSQRQQQLEGQPADQLRETLTEWAQDTLGNVISEHRFGEVKGDDKLTGNDESFIERTFANNTDEWLLGYLATEETQEADGTRRALKRNYYDGAPFVGLALGGVARGDLTRQEEWVGPDPEAFELDTATRFNSDGQPVETKDARDGGRIFEWNPKDHTSLLSEKVKLESNVDLTEHAVVDPRFGSLLSVMGYNGQTLRFEVDPLGRLTKTWKPGDAPDSPTTSYTYSPGAPLSRVITESRTGVSGVEIERSETLSDGLGRRRGTLTRVDGDQWVLAGVSLLNTRGESRKSLRPRFVALSAVGGMAVAARLLEDAPGTQMFSDALGRTLRSRSESGIETRSEYYPFEKRTWDGGQLDPQAGFEMSPSLEKQDGLGRTIASVRTLEGKLLTASYRYDAAGRLLARTDPEGNTATYGYDGRGRRVLVQDPDLGTHRNVWDATGNLIERHRPDGTILKYNFDLAGRLVSEDWGADGSLDVIQHWDALSKHPDDLRYRGKLVSIEDKTGGSEFVYDERSRVTATIVIFDKQRFTTKSQFDNLDRESLHVYPDGSSIRIGRNSRGQMAQYGDALSISYDGDGLETERRFNTGVVQKINYDVDRRFEEQQILDAAATPIEHLKWSYDHAGNLRALQDLRPDISADLDRSEAYRYDNLYRLRQVEGRWGKAGWTYSPSGNLLARDSTIASQRATNITYGASAGPHAATAIDGKTLSYDKLGRLTNDGTRSYNWNFADQLETVTNPDGSRVENRFDSNGIRRFRTETDASGKASTVLFISPWSEVRDGKLERFIVHGGRRVARLAADNGTNAVAAAGPAEKQTAESSRDSADSWNVPAWLLATGQLLFAPLLLLVLGWHYRKRLVWAARILVVGIVLLLASACGGDAKKSPAELPPEGSVKVLTASDKLILSDQLGSVIAETTGTGEVTGRFASYPFGVSRYDTSAEMQRYATGIRDTSAGLDLMGARFYSHALGFWTSGDPVAVDEPERYVGAEFGAANPYAYVNLTPLIAVDKDGEFLQIIAGALGGALLGAAIGGGIEAARQYVSTGKVEDWGRVGAASFGGAISGAIIGACPAAGLLGTLGIGAVSNTATGLAERGIASGGKDFGTAKDVLIDASVGAATAGITRGLTKAVGRLVQVKPAGVGNARPIGATGKVGEAALEQLGGESQVFFRTSQGGRFVDQLVNQVAHESKVGYQSLTPTLARQIAKDSELVGSGQLKGAVWHFFESPVTGKIGPSGPLQNALENASIGVEVHW